MIKSNLFISKKYRSFQGFMFHQERCHDSGPNGTLPNDNRSNDTGPMFELMFNKLASDIYIKKATNFNISQCE